MTKAQTVNSNKALVLCIAGGKDCDVEMDRQPAHARTIKTELACQAFSFGIEMIDVYDFLGRYPDVGSRTSKWTKEKRL